MRRLYEKLQAMLRGFIDQRDDLLLLVAANDSDSALVLQCLREFDEQSAGDLVLLFGEAFDQPFASADCYLDSLAAKLRSDVEVANAGALPTDTPLPPPPEAMAEGAVPPPARLKLGLGYAASLVDPRGGQRYVWGMVPGEIKSADQYAALLAALPALQPEEWMRGGRVIARVPANFDLARSPLAGKPRVRVERFHIPHDAHEQELLAALNDPAALEADRMGAAVQLGFIDAAHNRLEPAAAHFNKALVFFQWVKLPAMAGLVMVGLGDVARRRGDAVEAKRWFESALVPAVESESPILLSNVVENLATTEFRQGQYGEAAARYAALGELRRTSFDEDGVAESLEWEGVSLDKAGRTQDAVMKWYEAALIGRTFNLEHRLPSVLPRLRDGYERLGWTEAVENFDESWKPQGVSL